MAPEPNIDLIRPRPFKRAGSIRMKRELGSRDIGVGANQRDQQPE
jgi:hypothetical protein